MSRLQLVEVKTEEDAGRGSAGGARCMVRGAPGPDTRHPTPDSLSSAAYCLFQQPWWLDAVAPEGWEEAAVIRGGEVAARMPYVRKRKYGLTVVSAPPFTPRLGPWLRESEAKYANQLSDSMELLQELIDQLPRCDYFCQSFTPEMTNWLPFYWSGYQQTSRATYRIEDLTDLERVWGEFRRSRRRNIRKAASTLIVRDDLDVPRLYALHEMTYRRQGLSPPHSLEVLRRADEAAGRLGVRCILSAEDARGQLHAADYFVWDESSAFGLVSGADPDLRASGAQSLLVWEAIQFASKVTRRFDFGGSMLQPVEGFFRSFGARQVPYFHVTKASRRMRALMGAREVVRALWGRE